MCLTCVAFVDGLTSQNGMPVDGEGLPGKALKKIQILEATDENDLNFAIPVFRLGTHSDNEEDHNDGTYRGIRAAR